MRRLEETRMKIAVVVAGLVALAMVVEAASNAGAEPETKKRPKPAPAQARQPTPAPTPKPDSYVERDANKLPFGSAQWWDQMLRENRAGQCCN
jgi:hypothetical protein